MQATVINQFICRITGQDYKPGQVIDLSDFRAGELYAKGKIQVSSDVVAALSVALQQPVPSFVEGGVITGSASLEDVTPPAGTEPGTDGHEKKEPAPEKEKAEASKVPGKKEKQG